MKTNALSAALFLAAALPRVGGAQPRLPAVHLLDRPIAVSANNLAMVVAARQLPNGTVLVSDGRRRQLILLDSALMPLRIVADSTPGATTYGARPAPLIPYRGDSTVFVLAQVPSMYMLDREGRIARVLSVPRPEDAMSIASTIYGFVGFDSLGRVVYRGPIPRPTLPDVRPGSPPQPIAFPDSAPVVRADPATRKLDTIATIRSLPIRGMRYPTADRRTVTMIENNPIPVVDDWGVFADGTVGVLRGRDYHIDFIGTDGHVDKGPRMAFAWEPLTDEAKVAYVDSLKRADSLSRAAESPAARAPAPGVPATGAGVVGGAGQTMSGSREMPFPEEYPLAQSLPDYRPAFTIHAIHPDADDNFWIQTTLRGPYGAGDVYDVVSRQGVVVDRVQLPPGRGIAGFGAGGIVLLRATDAGGTTIEKIQWRKPTLSGADR